MSTILFVEESDQSLHGALRSLGAEHGGFEVLLCANEATALELLQQRSFSGVVAGFGADAERCGRFLGQVRERHPEAIRFALLSPQGEGALPEVEAANQTYSNTIPLSELERALAGAIEVGKRNRANPELGRLLSGFSRLPSAPMLYFDLKELLQDPDCDNRRITALVGEDPVISARILKLANSSFYALPRTVTDLGEAVAYLGSRLITSLVLAIHVFRQLPVPGFNIDYFWRHSLAISSLAGQTARQLGCTPEAISAATVAGLLHDMGQLMFLSNLPERYFPLLRQAREDERLLLELEEAEFGISHAELCASLLSLWSLPQAVVEAVAGHHRTVLLDGRPLSGPGDALALAEWMMQKALAGGGETEEGLRFPNDGFEALWQSCLHLAGSGVEGGL